MDIKSLFSERKSDLTRRQTENELLERQALDSDELTLQFAKDMNIAHEALEFLEEVANSRRGAMKGKIEKVLTEAVQFVYGAGRRIELTYAVKNNRSHLDFELIKQTPSGEVCRVLDGTGGGLGVSDTCSVPLRLSVLLGAKNADRVCFLDECYKHLDQNRIRNVVPFLRVLTDRLGIQVILLTHHTTIQDSADVSFLVEEGAEQSKVTRL